MLVFALVVLTYSGFLTGVSLAKGKHATAALDAVLTTALFFSILFYR